ncbi:hydrogenase nickel incorporation protein HypB [Symbiobacterium terraclitae]|uniref:Hydrogenase nickel incorporation protein HypB n=1 Tax=Symbiobacterium terraclitae TaxID=557451 RepID=A0ABS4JTP0_9FIRM|nr:hydrogenase nickel incorporation protein HypB [Symbiobacterium terraclitae]
MEVKVVERILKVNDAVAQANRSRFDAAGVLAVNIIGSPGAGKTTVLERTVEGLKGRFALACIEGDPYTTRDAERIAALDCPVVQINTQGGCHLDASLVSQALEQVDLGAADLLLIENVGNLLCPSQYDLGEHLTVVVLSVTEGADKPEKYPAAFQRARAVIVSKIDALALTDVDLDDVSASIRRFNPQAEVFPLSARTGEGVEAWLQWLAKQVRAAR